MAGRVAYLDSSAFVKLVVAEPESTALVRALTRWPDRASASILRTEAIRALRRSGNHDHVGAARRLLQGMHLIGVDEALLDRAGDLDPADLRSLDALHLAAAAEIGSELGVMFVYDHRLREAAVAFGIDVASPA